VIDFFLLLAKQSISFLDIIAKHFNFLCFLLEKKVELF